MSKQVMITPDMLQPLGFDEISNRMVFTDVEARVPRMNREIDFRVLGRVRGAIGNWLQNCDQAEASEMFATCYGLTVRLSKSLDLPRPFLLQMDQSAEEIILRMRLFADTQTYADIVACGFNSIFAKRGPQNPLIDLPSKLVISVARRGIMRTLPPVQPALHFLTPMTQREGQHAHINPASVMRGIFRRVSGIAALYGWRDIQPISHTHTALDVTFGKAGWDASDARAHVWSRRSSRQSMGYTVQGLTGYLVFNAPIGSFGALIDIGQSVHAGAKATTGNGRFRLVDYG